VIRGRSHLGEAEALDAAEGSAGFDVEDHLLTCPSCRGRVDEVREGWRLAEEADVPEPPPLYWESFRRQVGRRIDESPASRTPMRLGAILAAAAVLAGVALLAPWRGGERTADPTAVPEADVLPAWSALPDPQDDTGFRILEALAASNEAGFGSECRLAECLVALSDEESQALAEELRTSLPDADAGRSES